MKKKIALVGRIVFGLLLVAFGLVGVLNMFFAFAPPVQYADSIANQFVTGMNNAKYIPTIVSLVYLLSGVSMLVNRFVPLALVLCFPISLNIVLFHLFLDMQSILPGLVIGLLNVYLLFVHLEQYKPFLKAKSS